MAKFELIDTIVVTPSDRYKYITLSEYGKEELVVHGNIPLTANDTAFNIGIGYISHITTNTRSNVYPNELFANIFLNEEGAMGIVGFNDGWGGGTLIGPLLASPRENNERDVLKLGFFPYVEGDEEAVIQIYGR